MSILANTTRLPDPEIEPTFYQGVLVKRGMAWVVDIVIITVLTTIAGILTLSVGFFLWPLFFLAIGALYRFATLASGSATWGMRLVGIELRGHDCGRFGPVEAVLHVSGYYASVFFVLPAIASVAAMAATGRRQGLTDLILGSAAINRPS